MQQGNLVEVDTAENILNSPTHPYTKKLISAVPLLDPPASMQVSNDAALVVNNLSKTYRKRGVLQRSGRVTHDRDGVSMYLPTGGTLGVVDASGAEWRRGGNRVVS